MLSVILIITGLIFICTALAVKHEAARLPDRYNELYGDGKQYAASVLDCHTEQVILPSGKKKKCPVMILQFRINEQKRTVVHRCTERFFGKYSRGDSVNIIFCEAMPSDRAVIRNDNIYVKLPLYSKKISAVLIPLGIILAAAGILSVLL